MKKRAMKKQFSPPCSRLRADNGLGGRGDEGDRQSEEVVKRQRGITVNNRLLRGEDSEAFDNIMQKQLEIVEGTEQFYHRMDESLSKGRVEPYFLKEQWDLYAWREKFFNDNFPPGGLLVKIKMIKVRFTFPHLKDPGFLSPTRGKWTLSPPK